MLKTPLFALHEELGAKFAPFAGYAMPIHYPAGILAEHRHCRAEAALFDVSHMGQARVTGSNVARALEELVPADLQNLTPGRMSYSLLTNEAGGVRDDLMIAACGTDFALVVNAATKEADFAHLSASLAGAKLEIEPDLAMLALQGPKAAAVLGRFAPEATALAFLAHGELTIAGIPCRVSRSGYTGEDGFEISLPAARAEELARLLLAEDEVGIAGLGARDSLRLEAGLCLYGHDLDPTTTPIEAGLAWTVHKRRREDANFPGAAIILEQLREGPARKRVGLKPRGRAVLREGVGLFKDPETPAGTITSGGFGPTAETPLAMGYIITDLSEPGTVLLAELRGRFEEVIVTKLPFVPHRYHR